MERKAANFISFNQLVPADCGLSMCGDGKCQKSVQQCVCFPQGQGLSRTAAGAEADTRPRGLPLAAATAGRAGLQGRLCERVGIGVGLVDVYVDEVAGLLRILGVSIRDGEVLRTPTI